ncbi:uncharacterized protein [Linepithema humile]|uniref:uncharacterized protein n=1 Tax=Linepithema humile TaxID=83485 RepID=UPI00351EDF6C
MYITIDDEEFVPRHFAMCEFYGVETCFCWNVDKLIIFPYTMDSSMARDVQILSTPGPVKKMKFFDNRAFLICMPQGAYKLSRSGGFARLSKNALDIAAEYFQVFTVLMNGIYIDDKSTKVSKLLFTIDPNATEEICTFPLILKDTEMCFVNCFTVGWKTEKNLCIIAHNRRLFVLKEDTVQLVYTSNNTIMEIIPIKRHDKTAGLLLITDMDKVILIHAKDNNLVFEKIHLKRKMKSISAFCAGFNPQNENVLWILYCDQSQIYYVRKELFTDVVQETRGKERTFSCIQRYNSNVILGLSQKELVELFLEEFENSLVINNNINLDTSMFKKTDFIMEQVCAKVKELDILNKRLLDEQDKLRRINLYASKQKFQVKPEIEVSRLCNNNYLILNISEKLPKNSHVALSFHSKNHNTFCMKKVTEKMFNVKMPINKKILSSSIINIDLITLINEYHPWCLIQNFINCPSQDVKKKRTSKKDKTAFINAKIAVLQNLITEKKDLNMTRLNEIKKIIRAEL